MKKLTFREFTEQMIDFNHSNNITAKGGSSKTLKGVIVFTEDSFNQHYTLEERSYLTTNHNKRFLDNIGNSLYADCLDGIDLGVRLDWYISDGWKVEYCYIVE